jgi:hypothetical protein
VTGRRCPSVSVSGAVGRVCLWSQAK